jgi:hypothetical protein
MNRSLIAWAMFALLAACSIAFSGFAPQVEARETVAQTKADRLAVRSAAEICSGQVWPQFDTSCLRRAGSSALVQQARLVGASAGKQSRR